MTIEELKSKKTELGLTNSMIATASGLPVSTVEKIFRGRTKAPRKATLEAIEQVLASEAARHPFSYPEGTIRPKGIMSEISAAYSTASDRKYTIDDYYALPEDKRMELIDGVLYDMAAPSLIHQGILGELHLLFRECIDQHGAHCDVLFAPVDVRLDKDNYTMVQPDLIVLCHEYDASAARYEGAPDLTVEILSPSTRSRDFILKLYKYKNAGVREYWIVDPENKTVTVHLLQDEDYAPKIYGFDSMIPIGISEGLCFIDFSRVEKRIKKWESYKR